MIKTLSRASSRLFSKPSLPVIKEPHTRTSKEITTLIKTNGAISLHDYMKICSSFTANSFYSKDDVFLKAGHFVTSPHVSQLFGEMLALWFINLSKNIDLRELIIIELGPGDGTLLHDVIQTMHKVSNLRITKLVLVETSQTLRKKQLVKLQKHKVAIEFHESILSYKIDESKAHYIIAHEFFDALPILKFKKRPTDAGNHEWREILVNLDLEKNSSNNFRLEVAPNQTKNNIILSQYLTDTSNNEQEKNVQGIEIIPDMLVILNYIAKILNNTTNSACLIVDYGQKERRDDTLRAIRHHKTTSPLSLPGECDLTVNLCFNDIENFIKNTTKTFFKGPITQCEFLVKMGVKHRFKQLVLHKDIYKSDEEQLLLLKSLKRLINKEDMGEVYKFACITKTDQKVYPFK